MEVLPLEYVCQSDQRRVSFSNGHSFPSENNFLDYIVGKIHDDGFRVRGTSTIEESSAGLRKRFVHHKHVIAHRQGDEHKTFTCVRVPTSVGRIFARLYSQFIGGHVIKEWTHCMLLLEETIVRSRYYLIYPNSPADDAWMEGSILISTPNEGEEMEIQWKCSLIMGSNSFLPSLLRALHLTR